MNLKLWKHAHAHAVPSNVVWTPATLNSVFQPWGSTFNLHCIHLEQYIWNVTSKGSQRKKKTCTVRSKDILWWIINVYAEAFSVSPRTEDRLTSSHQCLLVWEEHFERPEIKGAWNFNRLVDKWLFLNRHHKHKTSGFPSWWLVMSQLVFLKA